MLCMQVLSVTISSFGNHLIKSIQSESCNKYYPPLEKFKKVQKEHKGLVLYSVRAPIEVDFILARGGELIWIEASDKNRYERAMAQIREGSKPISLKEFINHESLQYNPQPGIPKEVQMNTSYVQKNATIIIENNGTKEEFLAKAKQLVNSDF